MIMNITGDYSLQRLFLTIEIGYEMWLSSNRLERRYDLYFGGRMIGKAEVDFPDDKKKPVQILSIVIYNQGMRGHGYGSFLLERILADIDAASLACHLIAAGEGNDKKEKNLYAKRNARLYERYGFEITGINEEWSGYEMYRPRMME
jgi:GNAT superfamily N-acetyltransferase